MSIKKATAYAVLTVKAVNEDERVISGIATTPSTDREGDIIDSEGLTWKNPLPLLRMHKADQPVGTATFGKATKSGIPFTATLPKIDEPGDLQERVDMAWQEVKLGLVRGVSIGFRASEYSFMDGGGIHFIAGEVLELSLVTIPANAEATIQTIRSFDQREAAASGTTPPPGRRAPAAVAAPSITPQARAAGVKIMPKPIAEQIKAFEAARIAKNDRIDQLLDNAAEKGETLSGEDMQEVDTLNAEIKQIDAHIALLKDREKRLVATAKQVEGDTAEAASASRAGVPGIRPSVPAEARKGNRNGFARMLAARYIARETYMPPHQIAQEKGWGDDVVAALKVPAEIVQRAAIAAANTTDSAWAGPLVVYQNLQNEFIELLRPASIIARIPGLRRVPFNTKLPRGLTGNTAYWVGQGSPINVSAGSFDTVTLDFAKSAGLTFQTKELMRLSQPNSDQLLTDNLVEAITYLVDRDFLDPTKTAVTGVSPASITNGATSITPTGSTADAFRADFGSLLAAYTSTNQSLAGLVFVTTQTQAMRLSLMRNDLGQREFPDINANGGTIEGFSVVTSENIAAPTGSPADGTLFVALNARDILLADDGQVEVDVSTEASIQADSAPDSPQTASTVYMSLWQNDMVGIRCTRMINWKAARSTSVAYISGANYK